ncbi:MAG: glycosyltransferase, partial [Acidimicrobiia bacterium]|nr:glycosyltransferase [Acidimicrobiia bacterium]
MPSPLVRVVVLNYNGHPYLARTLDHLLATDWPPDRLDIVVIDNASTDDSRDEAAARAPAVRLIDSPENTGFPANNLALTDLHDVDHVALVNSDAFVEPGWLAPLVEALEADPSLGATCPRILLAHRFVDVAITTPAFWPGGGDPRELGVRLTGVRADGADVWQYLQPGPGVHGIETSASGSPFRWTAAEAVVRAPVSDGPGAGPWRLELDFESPGRPTSLTVAVGSHRVHVEIVEEASISIETDGPLIDVVNNAGSVVLHDGSGADRGFLEPDGDAFDRPADVFAWCGAAVVLRPEYLADVGLFDERFFLYYEDTDLSWRGRLRGWRYRYVPESRVRHLHAASSVEGSPMFRYFTERNRLLMLTKNAPGRLAWRAPLRFLWSTAAYARRDIVTPVLRARRPDTGLVRSRLR